MSYTVRYRLQLQVAVCDRLFGSLPTDGRLWQIMAYSNPLDLRFSELSVECTLIPLILAVGPQNRSIGWARSFCPRSEWTGREWRDRRGRHLVVGYWPCLYTGL